MLIDTHSHLFLEEFEADLPDVMQRAKSVGISKIFMPNIDMSTIASLLKVCQCYEDYCYPMLGLHPTSVASNYLEEIDKMKSMLKEMRNHPFVAIGEIGLDLYWDKTFVKEQQDALDIQLQWALENELPVVIHCRDAFEELYDVLKLYQSQKLRGIFHCFTGSEEMARRFMEFEHFMFGVYGTVTFKKSVLPEMLRTCIPLSRLVLETDSPYLSPVPYRGRRNETSYIIKVQEKVAEIYGESLDSIGRITSENAMKVFFER